MEFLKKMRENREEKVKALENVLNAAKTENRAMTAEIRRASMRLKRKLLILIRRLKRKKGQPRRKTRGKRVTMVPNRKRRRNWKKEPL